MRRRYCWFFCLIIATMLLVTACSTPAPAAPTVLASPTALPQPTAAPATSAPTAVPPTAIPTQVPPTTAPTTAPTVAATAAPTTAPTATPTTAPTRAATSAPTVAAQPTTSSSGGQSGKINLDAILPAGKGRDLLLNNCTSCHSFVCAVVGQRTVDYWETVKLGHKERVSSLSTDDVNTLFTYLETNFNDKKPIPQLPPELAGVGCSAQ
jgi:hypothetical protein